MYTIDLLKGEGIPIRSRPAGIAFACLVVAVPVLAGIGAATFYEDCQVVIAVEKQQLRKLDAALETLSAAVAEKEALERDRDKVVAVLSDVKASLQGRIQWSGILVDVVQSLSEPLVLTRLETQLETVRRKVPDRNDPENQIDVSVPVRSLRIRVRGRDAEVSYDAVRDLQDRLRRSPEIGPRLDTVTVSQEVEQWDEAEAVAYELNCMFKPVIP
jgi:Tfp pilus assembly protein PilN